VALDGIPWPVTFSHMVTDLTFDPTGRHTAALGKNGAKWYVALDGAVWRNSFERVWQPVFSSDGEHLAVKVERNGKYTVAVDDCIWQQACDTLWPPTFSPDGRRLLVRSIEGGVYHRRIIPVSTVTG
jgi:hypothetical protein